MITAATIISAMPITIPTKNHLLHSWDKVASKSIDRFISSTPYTDIIAQIQRIARVNYENLIQLKGYEVSSFYISWWQLKKLR